MFTFYGNALRQSLLIGDFILADRVLEYAGRCKDITPAGVRELKATHPGTTSKGARL